VAAQGIAMKQMREFESWVKALAAETAEAAYDMSLPTVRAVIEAALREAHLIGWQREYARPLVEEDEGDG
jgi:hypothetical protein